MKTLISMTDFVLQIVQTSNVNEAICWEQTEERLQKIYHYGLFLKQPLTLGMFVPCDKHGSVLKGKPLSPAPDSEWIRWENEEFEFYEAKEKVLFEGFHYVENNTVTNDDLKLSIDVKIFQFIQVGSLGLGGGDIGGVLLENLAICGLEIELTESAIKQIGL